MSARIAIPVAILLASSGVSEAQTAVAPCQFDHASAVGTASVPVKGWIRRGARCGVRFSAPSAVIAIGAQPAHGSLAVDQNEMAFIYSAPKDYSGPVEFTVMLTYPTNGQSGWFNFQLDVR